MVAFPRLCKALEHLVDRWGPVEGRTRFMKLIYLADLEWARTHSGDSVHRGEILPLEPWPLFSRGTPGTGVDGWHRGR